MAINMIESENKKIPTEFVKLTVDTKGENIELAIYGCSKQLTDYDCKVWQNGRDIDSVKITRYSGDCYAKNWKYDLYLLTKKTNHFSVYTSVLSGKKKIVHTYEYDDRIKYLGSSQCLNISLNKEVATKKQEMIHFESILDKNGEFNYDSKDYVRLEYDNHMISYLVDNDGFPNYLNHFKPKAYYKTFTGTWPEKESLVPKEDADFVMNTLYAKGYVSIEDIKRIKSILIKLNQECEDRYTKAKKILDKQRGNIATKIYRDIKKTVDGIYEYKLSIKKALQPTQEVLKSEKYKKCVESAVNDTLEKE